MVLFCLLLPPDKHFVVDCAPSEVNIHQIIESMVYIKGVRRFNTNLTSNSSTWTQKLSGIIPCLEVFLIFAEITQ